MYVCQAYVAVLLRKTAKICFDLLLSMADQLLNLFPRLVRVLDISYLTIGDGKIPQHGHILGIDFRGPFPESKGLVQITLDCLESCKAVRTGHKFSPPSVSKRRTIFILGGFHVSNQIVEHATTIEMAKVRRDIEPQNSLASVKIREGLLRVVGNIEGIQGPDKVDRRHSFWMTSNCRFYLVAQFPCLLVTPFVGEKLDESEFVCKKNWMISNTLLKS